MDDVNEGDNGGKQWNRCPCHLNSLVANRDRRGRNQNVSEYEKKKNTTAFSISLSLLPSRASKRQGKLKLRTSLRHNQVDVYVPSILFFANDVV